MFNEYVDLGYFLSPKRGMYIVVKPDFNVPAKAYRIY